MQDAILRDGALRGLLVSAGCDWLRRIAPRSEGDSIVSLRGFKVSADAFPDVFVVSLRPGVDPEAAYEAIAGAPGIIYAEPDYSLALASAPASARASAFDLGLMTEANLSRHLPLTPNDPLFGSQWALRQTNDRDIDADEAWDIATGSSAVVAAILDTGLRLTHEDYNAPGKILVLPGSNLAYGGDNPDDDHGHGTEVAGVLGALTNNGVGVAGVAGGAGGSLIGARLMPVKIFDANANGTTSTGAAGVNFAVSNGASLINFSAYCFNCYSETFRSAVNRAFIAGRTFVAAKGDEGNSAPTYPADFDQTWMISVGASDSNDVRLSFSNSGNGIDVVAPGFDIMSTSLFALGYTSQSGTSFAAPQAAGVAALLLSVDSTLLPEDINAIIRASADDRGVVGYDDLYGAGRLNARRALDLLRPPYVRQNLSAVGGTVVSTSGTFQMVFQSNGVGTLGPGLYVVKRKEVRRTVSFGTPFTGTPIIWGRWVSAQTGWSAANPNYQVGWVDVVSSSATSATLRTHVYEVWTISGSYLGHHPTDPANVRFDYGTIAIPQPFTVTAGAPGLVTVKATYSLTGSANYPASGWQWDQSYNGGPWQFWSNQQNSAFVAFGGNYTLDWRLFARRNSGGSTAYGYAQTRVCIPYSQATCGPLAAPAQPVAVADGARRLHFGSGVWLGMRVNDHDVALRLYSFAGNHVGTAADTSWPNLLERDSLLWVVPSATQAPGVRMTSVRRGTPGRAEWFEIKGQLGRPSGRSELQLALAADPDLGAPGDDALGFDRDMGLAWVTDADSAFVGYVALGLGFDQARLHQLGLAHGDEPNSPVDAYALMVAPSSWDSAQATDVRFLLTVPRVSVQLDGSFGAAFAVLRGASLAELRTLAVRTQREFAMAVARGGLRPDGGSGGPTTFSLRQSRSRNAASPNYSGTAALDARAGLQREGLVALDYAVPQGRDVQVRIRIYSNTGQLVRTLVDAGTGPGEYHVEWDRLNERGERVSPGVYVAVMEAGEFRATRRLVVTR